MRLTPRGRSVILFGAVLLAGLAIYILTIEPLAQRRDQLRSLTTRMSADLQEMRNLAGQYQTLSAAQARFKTQVQARGADFTPFSFLENTARESGLTGRIESMTPVASTAADDRPALAEFDVRMSGIGLAELTRFLYQVESSDKVFFVVGLNIRPRYLSPALLDVSLRLGTPKT